MLEQGQQESRVSPGSLEFQEFQESLGFLGFQESLESQYCQMDSVCCYLFLDSS